MLYGVGFSFGGTITKNAWKKFVAKGRNLSIWAALTGGGLLSFVWAILVMVFGVTIGCVMGIIFCAIDLIRALTGKGQVSDWAKEKYGDVEYTPYYSGREVAEQAVRYNYQDHGTAEARDSENWQRNGYTPDQRQVHYDVDHNKNRHMWQD